MERLKIIFAIQFCLFVFSNSFSQEVDSLRLAINDELKRNISELKSDDLEAPFYISYSVKDYEIFVVNASLGGLLSSDFNHVRSSNTRVLVGGYEFNDESLMENSVEPYYTANDMEVPLENDYKGIRRALWLSTDKVYKTAGEIFNRHKAQLKEKEKKIEEVPHLKFYKAKPVVITKIKNEENIDVQFLENKITHLSSQFLNYPDVSTSGITLTVQNELSYFSNSEGTDVKLGDQIVSIYIRAALQDENGAYIFDQKRYSSDNLSSLFEDHDFEKVIDDLCKTLVIKQSASKLDDSYEGPVLFLNETVADIFARILAGFSPKPPKTEDEYFESDYENTYSLESKLGKKVLSENLSIKLSPTLKNFDGKPLLGSFYIDDEGIVPQDEIVLVDNGVIKNLMTSRNYKKPEFIPNGTGQKPGVVEIDVKSKLKTVEDLKSRMLEIVKEEGLEFGVIIKESNNLGMLDIYKLYSDGNEVLFTNASLEELDIKTFRKIEGATKSKNVFNKIYSNGFTTFITPSAMLLEEVEIEPLIMTPIKLDLPLVENPIKAITEEN